MQVTIWGRENLSRMDAIWKWEGAKKEGGDMGRKKEE